MSKTLWLMLLAWAAAAAPASAAVTETVVRLNTRGGETESYLLTQDPGVSYQAAAVLFPGGGGALGLSSDGSMASGGDNFLVRSRALFAAGGVAAALVDAPSDHSDGMDDAFRSSPDHAQDVAAVVADLKKRLPAAQIYLVGTSRGTVSAAYAGSALSGQVAGVVLTSGVYRPARRGPGLSSFPLSNLPGRVLLVQHASDACKPSRYAGARAAAGTLPLVKVTGGPIPQSGPCAGLSPHGFYGQEQAVVSAITSWILGASAPSHIP